MQNALDEYPLEAIGREHPIAVAMFVPFAIVRLSRHHTDTEVRVRVRMRNLGGQAEVERMLRLFWSAESAAAQPLAVQDHIVTEWAALAMACVVVAKYTPLRMRAVALQGDRFDYWVTDGRNDYGLEISGTVEEDIEDGIGTKCGSCWPILIGSTATPYRHASPSQKFFSPSIVSGNKSDERSIS